MFSKDGSKDSPYPKEYLGSNFSIIVIFWIDFFVFYIPGGPASPASPLSPFFPRFPRSP